MTYLQTLLAGIAGLALAGCVSFVQAESLPIRSLAKSTFSGIQDRKEEVIKDKAAWERLWTSHVARVKDAPPRPEVDFDKEMVIVAAMGQQNTGGYSIQITGVSTTETHLQVEVTRKSPPPGAMTIQALTAPIHMVAVSRSALPPRFVHIDQSESRRKGGPSGSTEKK